MNYRTVCKRCFVGLYCKPFGVTIKCNSTLCKIKRAIPFGCSNVTIVDGYCKKCQKIIDSNYRIKKMLHERRKMKWKLEKVKKFFMQQ